MAVDAAGKVGEADDAHTFFINRKSVDDSIVFVLPFHRFHEVGEDGVAGVVVDDIPIVQHIAMFADRLIENLSTAAGNDLLIRLVVVVSLAVYHALAVAYHPHFLPLVAVDDGAGTEPLLGMLAL